MSALDRYLAVQAEKTRTATVLRHAEARLRAEEAQIARLESALQRAVEAHKLAFERSLMGEIGADALADAEALANETTLALDRARRQLKPIQSVIEEAKAKAEASDHGHALAALVAEFDAVVLPELRERLRAAYEPAARRMRILGGLGLREHVIEQLGGEGTPGSIGEIARAAGMRPDFSLRGDALAYDEAIAEIERILGATTKEVAK